MREIIEALKLRILYWLDISTVEPDWRLQEISYLRDELTRAREEISRITNLLYNAQFKQNVAETEIKDEEIEPIRSGYTPWPIQRARLERADRIKAAELRKQAQANLAPPTPIKTTEELEEELLPEVKENDAISRG